MQTELFPLAPQELNLTKRVTLAQKAKETAPNLPKEGLQKGYCILKQAGAYSQLTILKRKPVEPPTRKISKTEFVDIKTGEVKEYQKQERTSDERIKRIRKRMEEVKWRIRANETDIRLFITLTYAQEEKKPMTDTKKLYQDFKVFIQRLKRLYPKEITGYMCFCEPQENTSWHCHVLLLSKTKKSFKIPNELIERAWGQGFTKTQNAKNIIDIANYLTSYLTNIMDEKGKKSSRLHLYPEYFNFVRTSRNLKEPYTEKINADEKAVLETIAEIGRTSRLESDFEKCVELEEGGFLQYRIMSFITDERAEELIYYRKTYKLRKYIQTKINKYLRQKFLKQTA